MSNDNKAPFHFNPFHYTNPSFFNNQNLSSSYNINNINGHQPLQNQQQLGFDDEFPSHTMSFRDFFHGSVDYNTLSNAFDMSCSSSEVVVDHRGGNTPQHVISSPPTNSSVSSSSHEAEEDRDRKISKKDEQENGEDMGEKEDLDKSKKASKLKKKEKSLKEPRFAFLTKSEVDNLEDGYRWRKYGQKAVKNSHYPRSYYRCTYQKCTVKKRIERSFQDPSVVITTYEGQHNHGYPSNVRGNSAGSGPFFGTSVGSHVMARSHGSFQREQQLLLSHLLPVSGNASAVDDPFATNSTIISQQALAASQYPQLHAVFQEHGLLPGMDPFLSRKSEI